MNETTLLESWKEKAGGWRWMHYHSMHHYKRINSRFMHSSIILSTFAGAGGFSTAGQQNSDTTVMGKIQFYMGYAISAVNVFIGLINSFQRFGKAAEKTEMHGSAALQYAMLQRLVETELSLAKEHRKSDLITHVRQEMDRLLTLSPPIPSVIVNDFMKTFPDAVYVPDVCNQLKTIPTPPVTPMRTRISNIFRTMKHRQSLDIEDISITRPMP
jgi:hypothetical protein